MTRKANSDGKLYVANESFWYDEDGVEKLAREGKTRVREGHALLERFPHLFDELDAHHEVEAATAAPGEKRGE